MNDPIWPQTYRLVILRVGGCLQSICPRPLPHSLPGGTLGSAPCHTVRLSRPDGTALPGAHRLCRRGLEESGQRNFAALPPHVGSRTRWPPAYQDLATVHPPLPPCCPPPSREPRGGRVVDGAPAAVGGRASPSPPGAAAIAPPPPLACTILCERTRRWALHCGTAAGLPPWTGRCAPHVLGPRCPRALHRRAPRPLPGAGVSIPPHSPRAPIPVLCPRQLLWPRPILLPPDNPPRRCPTSTSPRRQGHLLWRPPGDNDRPPASPPGTLRSC